VAFVTRLRCYLLRNLAQGLRVTLAEVHRAEGISLLCQTALAAHLFLENLSVENSLVSAGVSESSWTLVKGLSFIRNGRRRHANLLFASINLDPIFVATLTGQLIVTRVSRLD
jgi:hypothetical protein